MARIATIAIALVLAAASPLMAQDGTVSPFDPAFDAGIVPKGDVVLGQREAPVLVEEFASLTCQSCADFHADTFPAFSERYIETGLVRYALRPLPLDPVSAGAFMLARCGDEAEFYPRVEHLFRTQGLWSRSETPGVGLLAALQRFGFDEERYAACLADEATLAWIVTTQDKATGELGLKTTPTFIIEGTLHEGILDIDQLAAIIDPLLAARAP